MAVRIGDWKTLAGLPLLAILCIALPATAQEGAAYRSGVPEVLSPAAGAAGSPASVATSFRVRYRQQGSPRLALFWMRRLSDRTVPEQLTVSRTDETVAIGAVTQSHGMASRHYGHAEAGGWAATALAGQRSVRHEERSGPVAADGAEDWLPAGESATAETAMLQELRRAGVTLIDRSVILRTEGAKGGANPQAIEAAALRAKADLLAEVTALPSADSPGGVLYRVEIKAIRSGAVLASFTTAAEPRAGAAEAFVAKPGRGYVTASSGAPVGQELAWTLMERLSDAWGR